MYPISYKEKSVMHPNGVIKERTITVARDGKTKILTTTSYKNMFGVICPKTNMVMEAFNTEKEANEFRDFGFFGGYKYCVVKRVKIHA